MERELGSMVEIAVGRPLRRLYTYLWPEKLGAGKPGQRVLVPFGNSTVVGFVIRESSRAPQETLREVISVLDPEPIFTGQLLSFLEWAAEYYRYPLGEVLRSALPPGLNLGERPSKRSRKSSAVAKPEVEAERSWGAEDTEPVFRPNKEQAQAIAVIEKAAGENSFAPFLLHGVTGSGKTEVYMRAIASVLDRGQGALVLVPEIALTPQMVGRFRSRFGCRVAVLHSGLRPRERTREWERLRQGEARLAIGVRSAIFAPVHQLGIIVVDEEHDGSFKQEEKFRYQARDLAVVRAQQVGCPVVLGSATPSLESLQNVRLGRYRLLQLLQRVDNRPMPQVSIVDMRLSAPEHLRAAFPQLAAKMRLRAAESSARYESPAVTSEKKDSEENTESFPLLSPELSLAVEEVLQQRRQAILFLNRRGQSTYHLCLACGSALSCRRCAVSLILHRSTGGLLCHYCGYREPLPGNCPLCGGPIEGLGMGTEKVEEELGKRFPNARIGRLDRDSATSAEQVEALLSTFARGDQDILVGTQMVAKGHDFPGVTLVGVLLADTSLNLPDFRAAERTFQVLAQVAGRAGRGKEPGKVVVQTFHPQASAVACVMGHDYSAFSTQEMELRKAYHYPPYCRLLAVRIDGRHPEQTGEAAVRLVQAAAPLVKRSSGALRLLGPAPAPISRLKGKTRWQFLVKGPTARSLIPVAEVIEKAISELSRGIRVSLDVDPVSFL